MLAPAAWPGHSQGLRVLPTAAPRVVPGEDTDPEPLLGEEAEAAVLLESLRDPPVGPLGPGGPLLAGTGRAPGPVSVGESCVVEAAVLTSAPPGLSLSSSAGVLTSPHSRPHPILGAFLVTAGPGAPGAPPVHLTGSEGLITEAGCPGLGGWWTAADVDLTGVKTGHRVLGVLIGHLLALKLGILVLPHSELL